MTIETIMEQAVGSGPFAVIAVYLVVKQSKRIEKLEDYCKDTLATLFAETMEALKRSTEVIEKNNEVIRHCPKCEERD